MGKKSSKALTSRVQKEIGEEISNRREERVGQAPGSKAGTMSNWQRLDSNTDKDMPQEVCVSLKLDRTKACKIKKAAISPPTLQPRLQAPVIIHASPPKVFRTDPTNFMWIVQKLTGSSTTRSRCRKTGPKAVDEVEKIRTDHANFTSLTVTEFSDILAHCEESEPYGDEDLSQAQTEILSESAVQTSEEMELIVSEDSLSQTSSDDEDFLPAKSILDNAVFGCPETPNVFPFADDGSPRCPVPSSSSQLPMLALDESSFPTFPFSASSFQFSNHLACLDSIAENFTMPIQEPIRDSFVCPSSFQRDSSFSSLCDLPLLSPPRLDGYIY